MGLQMTLPKQYNALYNDFENAYWSIDGINYGNDLQGNLTVLFDFNCYASRDAKKQHGKDVQNLSFGASNGTVCSPILYMCKSIQCKITDLLKDVSTGGRTLPLLEAEQKQLLYNWLKKKLLNFGYTFIDVLE